MDSHRKRSTLRRLSVVCPMNEKPGAARGRAIVFRQHAVHDVLVDVDPERVRDDTRNPWTPEPRIARLELDDGLDECHTRPLRSGLLRAQDGGEQSVVLATHQRLMKRQERRGAYADGDLSDPSWTEEERSESAEQPVAQRQVRRPLASTAQDDHLLLEEEILRDQRSHATGANDFRGHHGQVKQREQEIPHARDSVGQTSGATQRCLHPGFSRELGIRECAVKGESTQPVKVRSKEVSVGLGSYPGDGEGDQSIEAPGTETRLRRVRKRAGRNASEA